ncbi:MAG: hypothetical protein HDT14_11010 [Oscillibacter sp.]|nr:hypothetical protein [Oscillibacter sp.]
MKKSTVCLLAALLCLTLAACAGEIPEDTAAPDPVISGPVTSANPAPASQSLPVEEPDPEPVWTVGEITVSLLQSAYPAGTKRLTLIFDNASDQELTYGEHFSCKKYEDGRWRDVDFLENTFFHDIAWAVSPGSSGMLKLGMDLLSEPLSEGLYRVTGGTMITGEDGEKLPAWQVSFRVASDAQPEPDYALYISSRPVPTVRGCLVTDRLPVLFINTTGEDGQVVDIPHLEKLREDGEWENVPFRDGVGFCGTPDPLPTGGRVWSEDIPTLWGALEDGRYRLGYRVTPSGGTEQTIYGEFTIYTPEGSQGLPLASK